MVALFFDNDVKYSKFERNIKYCREEKFFEGEFDGRFENMYQGSRRQKINDRFSEIGTEDSCQYTSPLGFSVGFSGDIFAY